jgi:hypothetical protein
VADVAGGGASAHSDRDDVTLEHGVGRPHCSVAGLRRSPVRTCYRWRTQSGEYGAPMVPRRR